MKLISMTEFVMQHKGNTEFHMNDTVIETGKLLQKVFKYAEFLRLPLTLGMFVPVDEEGKVLEKPKLTVHHEAHFDLDEMEIYHKAQEKVLFDDNSIRFRDCGKHGICVETIGYDYIFNSNSHNSNFVIEDLIKYDIELTPTALKQIGL